MTRFLVLSFIIVIFLAYTSKAFASTWYFPMTQTESRTTLKGFGILANDAFYKQHDPSLFPTKFSGYHAGQDLETFANEKDDSTLVPFYAVTDGTITYIGNLSGYGGVLLEELADGQHTALYGHIKLPANIKVGDTVQGGQLISYLGNNFSSETSGERKHLHFAIHKGVDLYFHGHEANLQILNAEWEDPIPFLKGKGAIEEAKLSPTVTSIPQSLPMTRQNFLEIFLSFLSRLFTR